MDRESLPAYFVLNDDLLSGHSDSLLLSLRWLLRTWLERWGKDMGRQGELTSLTGIAKRTSHTPPLLPVSLESDG